MHLEIPAAVVHLHTFASKDPYRSNIGCVMIEPFTGSCGERMMRAVATDGHRLSVVSWQVREEHDSLENRVLFEAADIKELAKISKTKDVILVSESDGTWIGWCGPVSVGLGIDTEANYPNYADVMPKRGEGGDVGAAVALNPAYVVDVMNHAKKTLNKHGVKFHADPWPGGGDSPGPMLITCDGFADLGYITAEYVIMPKRI